MWFWIYLTYLSRIFLGKEIIKGDLINLAGGESIYLKRNGNDSIKSHDKSLDILVENIDSISELLYGFNQFNNEYILIYDTKIYPISYLRDSLYKHIKENIHISFTRPWKIETPNGLVKGIIRPSKMKDYIDILFNSMDFIQRIVNIELEQLIHQCLYEETYVYIMSELIRDKKFVHLKLQSKHINAVSKYDTKILH